MLDIASVKDVLEKQLELLDAAGHDVAAAHLSMAIESLGLPE